jgi:acyl-homoserine-lactone acylase
MGRRSIALAVLCASAAAAVMVPAGATSAAHGDGYSATIRRTQYGIPHVSAGDYGGLGRREHRSAAATKARAVSTW